MKTLSCVLERRPTIWEMPILSLGVVLLWQPCKLLVCVAAVFAIGLLFTAYFRRAPRISRLYSAAFAFWVFTLFLPFGFCFWGGPKFFFRLPKVLMIHRFCDPGLATPASQGPVEHGA